MCRDMSTARVQCVSDVSNVCTAGVYRMCEWDSCKEGETGNVALCQTTFMYNVLPSACRTIYVAFIAGIIMLCLCEIYILHLFHIDVNMLRFLCGWQHGGGEFMASCPMLLLIG